MRVLVAEKIVFEGINYLEDAGHDVDIMLGLELDELVEAIGDYHALIVRSGTHVTSDVIEAADRLKIIGRAGIGVDNIDVEAATKAGITVCNAPTSNVVSAAEHTMGLMLAITRRLTGANASMRAGKWERTAFLGSELYGKTLGIVGLGRIGVLVAQRATAFGMRLIGYDPYCSAERAAHFSVRLVDSIDDICSLSDVITVHVPRSSSREPLFGRPQYARMRNGVYLINTAQGGVFDEEGLAEFVDLGKIAGAALDVFDGEPHVRSCLLDKDSIVLTPHIGASTHEAQERAGKQIAEYVALGLEGKLVPTAVNIAPIPVEVEEKVGPYAAACQMAGSVLAQLARVGISRLKVEVKGGISKYDPGLFATAALRTILSSASDDPVNFANADDIAASRGIEVTTSKDGDSGEYANAIIFHALAGKREIELGVTVSNAHGAPRIISIFERDLDLIPSDYFIVLVYEDKPGKLGIVGTVFGKHNINIRNLELGGKSEADGDALVLMGVDQEIPPDVRAEIEDAVDAKDAWYISLFGA